MRESIRRLFGLGGAVCGLWAQSTPPPPLVHLYPAVLDAKGQPVTDLTAADFKIADQGKSQTILLFRRPASTEAAALGPHEYTNRPGGLTPHSTAILFDLLNEGNANRLETWHALAKSIPRIEAAGQVYFYVLNLAGELIPIRPVEKDLNKALEDANLARPAGLDQEDRTKKTYHQLEVVANHLATLPGRRDLIWITNGVPSIASGLPCAGDWIECGLYVAHLGVTLEHDGVAIDPDYFSGVPQSTTSYDLEQMALLTGGRTFFHQDIGEVLQSVVRDARNSYEIAYAPSAEHWDNKFHKIRISCARKGVKLQVRERYYALRDTRTGGERQKEALMAAYQRIADATDIGLTVQVTPAAKSVHLEIRVDAGDLLLREQNGKFAGQVTVVLSDRGETDALDVTGLLVRPLGEPVVSSFAVNLTKGEHIQFPEDHPIGDAVRRVRLLVMDANTNAVGSITFPVR